MIALPYGYSFYLRAALLCCCCGSGRFHNEVETKTRRVRLQSRYVVVSTLVSHLHICMIWKIQQCILNSLYNECPCEDMRNYILHYIYVWYCIVNCIRANIICYAEHVFDEWWHPVTFTFILILQIIINYKGKHNINFWA